VIFGRTVTAMTLHCGLEQWMLFRKILAVSQEGSIATALQAEQTGCKCNRTAEAGSYHRGIGTGKWLKI